MIGTTKKFQVEWSEADSSVQITSGKYYEKVGGELTTAGNGYSALPMTATVYIDGNKTDLTGYSIDGCSFLTLSDIAAFLEFTVHIDSSSKTVAISDAPAENHENPNSYVLTLTANCSEALLNGEAVTLSAQPFIQNDTFYIPLKQVTELLGGTYSFKNGIATSTLFATTTKYKIASHSVGMNGTTYEDTGSRKYFCISGGYGAVDDNFAPVLLNGTVYIPNGFHPANCPVNNGLQVSREL
jgi:hypothetical protein